jgi:hypothetical protein
VTSSLEKQVAQFGTLDIYLFDQLQRGRLTSSMRDFETMVGELWRVLASGGVLFARLASSIGFENHVTKLRGRWHSLPDGTDRFLVDEAYLLSITSEIGAELLDPLKTTNVQNLRAMTTWVIGKP